MIRRDQAIYMREYNLGRIFFAIFPLIILAVFLVLPGIVLADEIEDIPDEKIWEYLELPKRDAKNLLWTLIQKFSDEWVNLFTSNYSSPEEEAVPLILRETVRGDILNYLMIDAPVEVSVKIIKTAVETTKLISTGEISAVIEKLEQETVKRAVNYGMDFLVQKEIKVTPGAIEFEYTTNERVKNKTTFQYLIIFQSLDKKSGKVEIKFFSSDFLEPPLSKQSVGGAIGIANDLKQDLPPFIATVTGTVEKTGLSDYYRWTEGPVIKIDFPEKVPDLGIKPAGFWERMVLRPIKAEIKQIKYVVSLLTQRASETSKPTGSIFDKAADFAGSAWGKIKSVLDRINPFMPASIVQTQLPEEKEQIIGTEAEETNENGVEILESEETAEPKPKILTLADVQEQLDEMEMRAKTEIDLAVADATAAPYPAPEEALHPVYAEEVTHA